MYILSMHVICGNKLKKKKTHLIIDVKLVDNQVCKS